MNGPADFWNDVARPGPSRIRVDGIEIGEGSRVLLCPRPGGDILDLALAGRRARVEEIIQDVDGSYRVVVTLEDDPGRDFGHARFPGHRFFFSATEVQPIRDPEATSDPGRGTEDAHGAASDSSPSSDPPASDGSSRPPATAAVRRVLVAGIGNVFLGDDGFGVEVVRRLAARPLPAGVDVVDYGTRGLDLTYALLAGYDAAILVDALPMGDAPGTLHLVEPEPPAGDAPVALDTHAMDPVRVLRLAATMGELPPRLRIIGCEPASPVSPEEYEDVLVELSEPVRHAIGEAVRLVEAQLAEWLGATARTNT